MPQPFRQQSAQGNMAADSVAPESTAPDFTATITEIRELCRVNGKPLFQLALDRSIFQSTPHPEPCVGTLTATSRLGTVLVAPILAVQRDEAGELWHTTAKPLQPGTTVICRLSPPNPEERNI